MAKAKKLPSGRWRVLVYSHTDKQGKRHYESFTADSKKEAEYMAGEFSLKRKRRSRPEDMTVGEAIDKYIESKENILSPATVRGYKQIRRNAIQGLMGVKLADLNPNIVQVEFDREATRYSPKSIANIHGLLSPALHMFYKDFQLETTLPQRENPEMVIPTNEEAKHLLEYIKGTDMEIPILLACCGGMRRSEIAPIDYSDFDYKNDTLKIDKAMVIDDDGVWHIKITKTTSSKRILKLPHFIIEKVQEREESGKPLIGMTPNAITDRFIKMREKLDISYFRFHDLRHYNASVMLALNVPDKYAIKRMGHSTTHMLKRVYQHIMTDKQEEVNESVNNFFDNL